MLLNQSVGGEFWLMVLTSTKKLQIDLASMTTCTHCKRSTNVLLVAESRMKLKEQCCWIVDTIEVSQRKVPQEGGEKLI